MDNKQNYAKCAALDIPHNFGRAIYGMMRNLIEIVFLLCFQNLLVYGLAVFALFSKFAPLTLANFEKGHFCLII